MFNLHSKPIAPYHDGNSKIPTPSCFRYPIRHYNHIETEERNLQHFIRQKGKSVHSSNCIHQGRRESELKKFWAEHNQVDAGWLVGLGTGGRLAGAVAFLKLNPALKIILSILRVVVA